jgi:hypothetical protein
MNKSFIKSAISHFEWQSLSTIISMIDDYHYLFPYDKRDPIFFENYIVDFTLFLYSKNIKLFYYGPFEFICENDKLEINFLLASTKGIKYIHLHEPVDESIFIIREFVKQKNDAQVLEYLNKLLNKLN